MISVLQASAWYPPASMGGTEVYVSSLVRELRSRGVSSTVIAPLGPRQPDTYRFEDATVRTYCVNAEPTSSELRGERPHDGFSHFRKILAELRPDVYHQHSLSRGLGLPHLRAARELGLRTVLTVHVPGVVCMRGTMMRFGHDVCDGRIDRFACAACWSHGRGVAKPVALGLAGLSSQFGSVANRVLGQGRLVSALSASTMVDRLRRDLAGIMENADRIVAVCQWLRDALALNGVRPGQLVLSRQGVDPEFVAAVSAMEPRRRAAGNAAAGKFRLLYLGRWQAVKGIDVLVRAVRAVPADAPLELVIHGMGDGPEERAYEIQVRQLAGTDPRIRIAPPVPRTALAETLIGASALAVPSRWLETGPLVVLEAKAARLPVLGSRLGGIAELIHEPDDGVLVPPDDVAAWTNAILHMMKTPSPVAGKALPAIRTMTDVAADMSALYRDIREAQAPRGASCCV